MRCTSIQCVHLLNEQKTTLHLLRGRRVQENSRNCLLTEMSVQRDLPYILRYAWRMSNMSISERDTIMRISVRSLVPIPCTQQTLFQLSLNSSNVELIHQLTFFPPQVARPQNEVSYLHGFVESLSKIGWCVLNALHCRQDILGLAGANISNANIVNHKY